VLRAPRERDTVTRILALESSCDETSAAVVSGDVDAPQLESLVILSQDVHRIFGGVVPEIASREHLTAVVPVTRQALADAGRTFAEVDAIAVTHAPGLVGALLVGVSYAKSLALRDGARTPRRQAAVHGTARLGRTHAAARCRGVGPLSPVGRDAR
jgi:hypothetical protein